MCSGKARQKFLDERDGKGQSSRTIEIGQRNYANADYICTHSDVKKACFDTLGLSTEQGKAYNGASEKENPARVSEYLWENNDTTARVTKQFLEITLTKIFPHREKEMKAFEDDLPKSSDRISLFFSVSKPGIGTGDYIRRVVTYAQCSEAAFVVALVYLERLATLNEKLRISSYNMHRLIITALMLAAKMLDDRCYSNAHYARVGGIEKVSEMNKLEREMLRLLDYRLIVSLREYEWQVEQMGTFIPPPKTSPSSVVEMNSPELETKAEVRSENVSSDGKTSKRPRNKNTSRNTPQSRSLTPSLPCAEVNA